MVINLPAMLPNLPPRPGQGRDVPHLHDRFRKVVEEQLVVVGVLLDERHRGRAPREEDLVGVQQAFACYYVLVVLVVELERAYRVQKEQVLVPARPGAAGTELSCVGRV